MPDPDADTPRPPDLYVVLDALDAPRLAEFWAAALGYQRHDPVGQYELLAPPEGRHGPVWLLQAVTDPKTGKNRMHVDLHVDDAEAEAERLVGLGARRLGDGSLELNDEVTIRWITMDDPEGNEFDLGWR